MGLKYTICLVSLSVSLALILVSAAPMMGMGLPLAELMVREAGMRSCALRSRLRIRVGPAKQLWQPVSARARVAIFRRSLLRVCLWVWKSARWVETTTSRVGWGGERRCAQVWDVWSQVWCGRVPSVMSLTTSWMAFSCSAVCQHIRDMWLGRPQDWHVLPNAGHWVLLMAVLALVPWPWRPQKQHTGLLFGCGVGVVGCRLGVADWLGLVGVALGGWCCCWRLYPLCSASPWSASSSMALLLAWGGVVIVVNDCLPVTLTIINCTSSSTVWSLSGSFNRSAWMSGSARPTHS